MGVFDFIRNIGKSILPGNEGPEIQENITKLLGNQVENLKVEYDDGLVRLSGLVVFTSAVGYIAACAPGEVAWLTLLWTVVGTALVAGAASAFNELWEVKRDARMYRTMDRPLPAGDLSRAHAYLLAMVMTFVGTSMVALGANLGAAGLNLLALLIYIFIYTPLKPRTTLNTLVGAVVGALPPMAGWVAATGSLSCRTSSRLRGCTATTMHAAGSACCLCLIQPVGSRAR